jgi:hypothetical protein
MVKKLKMKSEGKKSKKEKKVTLTKKRRFFSKEKKQQSKLSKILLPIKEPTIEQLINSLDSPIKKSKIYKDADFKLEFPSDIDDTKFEELFKKGINYAKMKFGENNLKALKTILLVLKDINGKNSNDDFGLKSCVNDLQKIYRKDLILTLLSSKNKIEEYSNSSTVEYEFKQSIDYLIYMDNLAFNNALLYNANNNNKTELYPFNLFKNIIFSPVILNVYREILDELYDVQTTENEIKKIIENFLKNHSIYFLYMNSKRYGLTLYDGTIVINRIYYGAAYTYEFAFIILWTLLHEIMHILSRLTRKDNNFFLDTGEFTMNKKIFSDESGNYFENKLLLSILGKKSLTVFEAKYLLKKENYVYKTLKDFQNAFITFRKLNDSQIKRSQSFAIGKESNDNSFSIKVGCYFHGERKND